MCKLRVDNSRWLSERKRKRKKKRMHDDRAEIRATHITYV